LDKTVFERWELLLKLSSKAEKAVLDKLWITIAEEALPRYEKMFQAIRIDLRDQFKIYDATILKIMRRVRCNTRPAAAECAEKLE